MAARLGKRFAGGAALAPYLLSTARCKGAFSEQRGDCGRLSPPCAKACLGEAAEQTWRLRRRGQTGARA
eukprot:11186935-Lingulodinium_polyedra.AAC.1